MGDDLHYKEALKNAFWEEDGAREGTDETRQKTLETEGNCMRHSFSSFFSYFSTHRRKRPIRSYVSFFSFFGWCAQAASGLKYSIVRLLASSIDTLGL